jgi:hypothetical protein
MGRITVSFEQDTQHRINQMRAKLGQNVVMPEDWLEINAQANALVETDFRSISVLDSDEDAQKLAEETVTNYHLHVGFRDMRIGALGHAGETEIATHRGPQYDAKNLETMNRSYAILAGLPESLIPLSDKYTWKMVMRERLKGYRICNVRVVRECQTNNAIQRLVVKRGEFVCLFAACEPCRYWFGLDEFERQTRQIRQLGNFWTRSEKNRD